MNLSRKMLRTCLEIRVPLALPVLSAQGERHGQSQWHPRTFATVISKHVLRLASSRVLLALVIAALLVSVASACPTCKEGLAEADPQQQSVAAGFYYSILFMMSMPFAILGTFGSLAYLSIRRARGQQEAADDDLSEV